MNAGFSLPGLDSNQEPIGFKPTGSDTHEDTNVIPVTFGKPQREDVTPHAVVAIGGAR